MKIDAWFALAAALAIGQSAQAREHSYSYHRSHVARGYSESSLLTHRHYINSSGHLVHSLSRTVSGRAPAGASAHCTDGSWSFSEHARGTCSHHGGVATWR